MSAALVLLAIRVVVKGAQKLSNDAKIANKIDELVAAAPPEQRDRYRRTLTSDPRGLLRQVKADERAAGPFGLRWPYTAFIASAPRGRYR